MPRSRRRAVAGRPPARRAPARCALTSRLGRLLRSWRERVDLREVGTQPSSRRRAVGLRRQELADLTGISVDHLARPEQVGAVALDRDTLSVAGTSLRVAVVTAVPGTRDADRLELLGAIGTGTSELSGGLP